MVKAVVFDCFGVLLVDRHTSFIERFPAVADQLREVRSMADDGLLERDEVLARYSGLTKLSREEIDDELKNEHVLNDALVDLMIELKSRYKIGMLTNLGKGWIDEFLPKHGIRDLFNEIVISGEEGESKPDPDIFRLSCERLGVKPEEAVMIDDLQRNVAGAQAAGMQAVCYQSVGLLKQELEELGVK